MVEEQQPVKELRLRVAEARQRDVGYGIARIDREVGAIRSNAGAILSPVETTERPGPRRASTLRGRPQR